MKSVIHLQVRPHLDVPVPMRLSPDFPQILSWSEKLAEIVTRSHFKPDLVIGLANKGLVPGKFIADHCSVPIYPLKISRAPRALIVNETDVVRKYREAPEVPAGLNFALNRTMHVLVVDESINTGASVIAAARLLSSFGVNAELLRIAAIADVQAPKIAGFSLMETDAKWFGGHFFAAKVDSDYVSWMAVHFPDIPVTMKKKFG